MSTRFFPSAIVRGRVRVRQGLGGYGGIPAKPDFEKLKPELAKQNPGDMRSPELYLARVLFLQRGPLVVGYLGEGKISAQVCARS